MPKTFCATATNRWRSIFKGEDQEATYLTFAELYREVSRLAKALKQAGVQVGDRVVGFMPNMPQTIIAMLAAASLGAIWSSCSPDFGLKGVLDRFGQIDPKVLFTANGYSFKGKKFNSLERIADILKQLPSIEKVVVVPYTEQDPNVAAVPNAVLYHDFITPEERTRDRVRPAAVRSSPLYHVLVRNHRSSQVYGSMRRRHSDSSPEGTDAPHRFEKEGYNFLFYDLRLDDVELVDQFSGRGGDPGAF